MYIYQCNEAGNSLDQDLDLHQEWIIILSCLDIHKIKGGLLQECLLVDQFFKFVHPTLISIHSFNCFVNVLGFQIF